jgi:hypothetical protein
MTRGKQFDPKTISEPVRALQETPLRRKPTVKDVEIAGTTAKEYDPDDPKTEALRQVVAAARSQR